MMHEVPIRFEELSTLQLVFDLMSRIEGNMQEMFRILSGLNEADKVPYCAAFQKSFYNLNAYLEALYEAYEEEGYRLVETF
jgi:hypothetical protein